MVKVGGERDDMSRVNESVDEEDNEALAKGADDDSRLCSLFVSSVGADTLWQN
jgi:hypothetical protein